MPRDAFVLRKKENYVPEMLPKSFWDFREKGPSFNSTDY